MSRRYALTWIVAGAMSVLAAPAFAQGKGAAAGKAAAPALPTQTIKIAFIDPLSGPFAGVGTNLLHHFQFMTDLVNVEQRMVHELV